MNLEETDQHEGAALTALLNVYRQRKDLQESFPEAGTGDHQRLITWAAGVAEKPWSDGSYEALRNYGEWYNRTNFAPKANADPSAAFKTWNRAEDSLGSIEARIHDGVPIDKLHDRADGFVKALSSIFPWAMPREGAAILEIGSGVGYIMEAACRKLHPSRMIGLDIAPAMIEKAKERLARDHVAIPAEFLAYDGITIPMAPKSVDFVYSVACLQHIPKPYVYNLFGEILRILKPSGTATLHFLSFSMLKLHQGSYDLKREIAKQLAGTEGHWHHCYSREELMQVLTYGYGAERVEVAETDISIWAAFGAGGRG
ncbi:MAG: class I SAM-dependent methyltransferase [Tepidisphaeraceae bacterium]